MRYTFVTSVTRNCDVLVYRARAGIHYRPFFYDILFILPPRDAILYGMYKYYSLSRSIPFNFRHTRKYPGPAKRIPYDDAIGYAQDTETWVAPEGDDQTYTDYQSEYRRLRSYMRAIDREIMDLVFTDQYQYALATVLGITQGAVSHRFCRAQHTLRLLMTRPPREGMRRLCHRYLAKTHYGRWLPVIVWLYCECTCAADVAKIIHRKVGDAWGQCKQPAIRHRLRAALDIVEKHMDRDANALGAYLRWSMEHPYALHTPIHTKTRLTDWSK